MPDDEVPANVPDPRVLVGKDELDEDDEALLDGAALTGELVDSHSADRAVPVLGVRDLVEAEHFYASIGFVTLSRHEGYLILGRNGAELHLSYSAEHDPATSDGMAYLRCAEVEQVFEQLRAAGVPRLRELEDTPWGMREFAVLDPSGNLLRVGRPADG